MKMWQSSDSIKYKSKKHHTVKTVPKSNQKIVAKSISLTHIYTIVHFPGL